MPSSLTSSLTRSRLPLLTTIAAAVLAAGSLHASAESKVPCTALPAAVLDHARTEAPNATIRGCVKDRENGKLQYEVETDQSGKSRDMTFDAAGNLIEVEQEIDRDALPAAVSSALETAANGGEVGKVESLTKGGAISLYETVVTRKGKKHEVAFRPDGTSVKPD